MSESPESPENYAETAVREVLMADDARVDAAVGYAALLLACVGAAGESDRLVCRWQAVTSRPTVLLVPDEVTARAWAMLFAARGTPDWGGELPPLDLDAEERAHRKHLAAGGPLRELAAEAEDRAREGDLQGASSALTGWARQARRSARPDIATLAACRHVAPLLVRGTLTVADGWARDYAGTLIAALHTRYRGESEPMDWRGLIERIMWLRGEPGNMPPPATNAGIDDAQRRLGVRLPLEYREFLLTCDGLPADVVFPRLLGTAELETSGQGVRISDPPGLVLLAQSGRIVESDPLFGVTTHSGIRDLLREHLRLLEAAL
ncbi:hypothetical protein FHU38_003845 [Saccharomonospora amisosensis]|uniref:Knr4/Smi1-like domain-containing protein n=1 Tax=Saccharomonospora amisosensis TaxID=1128677 RepID=A0A7X5USN7_9PSEU|nr:SMI1/KNR4 family protein [Saccharomonospora amisosensis]NIJ13501.1 hypothetical protein [Saccharomonospora amisosensis]